MEGARSPLQTRSLNAFTASPHSSGKTFVTQSVAHEDATAAADLRPATAPDSSVLAYSVSNTSYGAAAQPATANTPAPLVQADGAMTLDDLVSSAPTPAMGSQMTSAAAVTSPVTLQYNASLTAAATAAAGLGASHHVLTASMGGGRVPGHRARTPARSILHTSGSNHAAAAATAAAPSPAVQLAFSGVREAVADGSVEAESGEAAAAPGLAPDASSSSNTWARRSRVAFASPQAVFYPEAAPPAVISAAVPAELASGAGSSLVLMVPIPAPEAGEGAETSTAAAVEPASGEAEGASLAASTVSSVGGTAPEQASLVVHTVLSLNDEGAEEDGSSVESYETSMNSSILASWEQDAEDLETSVALKRKAREQRRSTGGAGEEHASSGLAASAATATTTRKRTLAERGDLSEEEGGNEEGEDALPGRSRRSSLAPPSAKRARRGSLAPTPAMLAAAAAAAAEDEEEEDEEQQSRMEDGESSYASSVDASTAAPDVSVNPLHVFSTLEAAAQAGFAMTAEQVAAEATSGLDMSALTAAPVVPAAAPEPVSTAASPAPVVSAAAAVPRVRSLSLSPGAISSTVAMAAAAVEAATAALPAGSVVSGRNRNAMVVKPNTRRFTIAGGGSRLGAPRARAASMGGPLPAPLLPPAANHGAGLGALPSGALDASQDEEEESGMVDEVNENAAPAHMPAPAAVAEVAAPAFQAADLDATADGRRVGAFLRGLLNNTDATFASSTEGSEAGTPGARFLDASASMSDDASDASPVASMAGMAARMQPSVTTASETSPVMSPIIRQSLLGTDGDFTLSSFIPVGGAFPSAAALQTGGAGSAGAGLNGGGGFLRALAAEEGVSAAAASASPVAPAPASTNDSALALGPSSPAALPTGAAWGADVTVDAPTSLGSLLQAEAQRPGEAAFGGDHTRTLGSLAGVLSEEVAAVVAAGAAATVQTQPAPRPAAAGGVVRPSRESLEFASLLQAEEAAAGSKKAAALPAWMTQTATAATAPVPPAPVAAPAAVEVTAAPSAPALQAAPMPVPAPAMQMAPVPAAPTAELKDFMARLRVAASTAAAAASETAQVQQPAVTTAAAAPPAVGRAALEAAVARSPAAGAGASSSATEAASQPQAQGVSAAAASFLGLPGFSTGLLPGAAGAALTGSSVLAAAFPALFGAAAATTAAAAPAGQAQGRPSVAPSAGAGFGWAPRASLVPAAMRRSLGATAAMQQALHPAAVPAVAPPVLPPPALQVTAARVGPLAAALPSTSSSSSLSTGGVGSSRMTFAEFTAAAGLRFLSDDFAAAEALQTLPVAGNRGSSRAVQPPVPAAAQSPPAATPAVEALAHGGRRLAAAVPRGPLPAAFAAPSVPLPTSTATGAAAAAAAEARARLDAKAAARAQSAIAALARKATALRARSAGSNATLGINAPLVEADVEEDDIDEALPALASQLLTQAVLLPERESLTWCAKTMQDVVRRDAAITGAAIEEWAEEQPFIFTAVGRAHAILRDHALAVAAGSAPAEGDAAKVAEAAALLDNVKKLKALHETHGRVQYLDWRRTTATNLLQTLSYNTAALKAEAAALQDEEAELAAAVAKMEALVVAHQRAAEVGAALEEVAPALQASLVAAATAKADATAAKAELAQATAEAEAADAEIAALQQAIAAEEEAIRRDKAAALAAIAAERDRAARGVADPEREAALVKATAASRAYHDASDALGGWMLVGALPGDAGLRALAAEGLEGVWRRAAAVNAQPSPIVLKLKHADGSAHTVSFAPTLTHLRTAAAPVGLEVVDMAYAPRPTPTAAEGAAAAAGAVGGLKEFNAAASRFIIERGLATPSAMPLRMRLAAVSAALTGLASLSAVAEAHHTAHVNVRFSQLPVPANSEGLATCDGATPAHEWVLAFDASYPAAALKFRVLVRGLFSVWGALAHGSAVQAVGANPSLVPEWLWVCGAPSPTAQASHRRRVEAALRALPATATLAQLIEVVGAEVERICGGGAI